VPSPPVAEIENDDMLSFGGRTFFTAFLRPIDKDFRSSILSWLCQLYFLYL